MYVCAIVSMLHRSYIQTINELALLKTCTHAVYNDIDLD